jgi:phenylalanyl-tRNA synthetase beta chain
MTPAEVLDRHPTGRTYGWILEGKALVPFLTDVQGEVLSFPPIINSARLGRVVPGMDALFVEVTGLAQDQCLLALNILATNLADRGWHITPVTTRYPYATPRGPRVTVPHAMPISQRVPVSEFSRLLGETVEGADVVARLRTYGVASLLEDDQVVATIPSYRQDYLHAVDVIEDYAISRGYDTLAPSMAQAFTVGRLHPFTELADLVRDRMISFGFEEAICNILTNNESVRTWMNLPTEGEQVFQGLHGGRLVRIANVMNLNYSVLRDWITPSLLEVEAHSVGALYPHRLFEVGEVAVYEATANHGSRSETRLAALIAEEEASFDSAQSVVYALLTALKIPFRVVAWAHPSFITGRVALIIADDERPLGFLGELAPQVLTHWGVRMPTAVVEVAVDRLYAYTLGKQ